MRSADARSDELWAGLVEFSDVFTCYSAALATWLAFERGSWADVLNPGLWLALAEADDGLFAFGHFPPGLRGSLGLVRRELDDEREALAGVDAELRSHGRVVVAGDGFNLPWHVAHGRRHVPHWFVLAGADAGVALLDPFACRNELGWQQPARTPLRDDDLPGLLQALPPGDPVLRLREMRAFGDAAEPPEGKRFAWFEVGEPEEGAAPDELTGPEAVGRLARHFRENGQDPAAYRQADDVWSIARHRAFFHRLLARGGPQALEELEPLTVRWSHAAPLIMQAQLALAAGRPASSSLADLLDELADREQALARLLPPPTAAPRG